MTLRFLHDLFRHPQRPRTVIVVDEGAAEPPRQYQVRPQRILAGMVTASMLGAVLLTAIVLLTPARRVVFGPDPEILREAARVNALRASALADSLELQREYLAVLRTAIVGPEGAVEPVPEEPGEEPVPAHQALELPPAERSADWADHESPAFSLARLEARERPVAAEVYLASLQFPALPPVDGFFARGYEASRSHFGIDIAVEEDTPVRAIGDGYVVFADWANDGGYTIAVQHAEGYLSIYMHNRRLLKRSGDRVQNRETIALSGNTGEVTTGPHLHFELWRNGLAQDPRLYLVGL